MPSIRSAIDSAVPASMASGFSTKRGSPASTAASSGGPWANGGMHT